MNGKNQQVTPAELQEIRSLDDFDLKMLLSEIQDHGWPEAKKLLLFIEAARKA